MIKKIVLPAVCLLLLWVIAGCVTYASAGVLREISIDGKRYWTYAALSRVPKKASSEVPRKGFYRVIMYELGGKKKILVLDYIKNINSTLLDITLHVEGTALEVHTANRYGPKNPSMLRFERQSSGKFVLIKEAGIFSVPE